MWPNSQIWFLRNITISVTLENVSVNITCVAHHCEIKLITNGNPANLIEYLKIHMAHVCFWFTSHIHKPDSSHFAVWVNLIQTELWRWTFIPSPYASGSDTRGSKWLFFKKAHFPSELLYSNLITLI